MCRTFLVPTKQVVEELPRKFMLNAGFPHEQNQLWFGGWFLFKTFEDNGSCFWVRVEVEFTAATLVSFTLSSTTHNDEFLEQGW